MATGAGRPTSPAYRMANRLLGGRLEQELRRLRLEGLSYEAIAQELSQSGVATTRTTLQSWCRRLGIEPAPDRESA